MLFLFNLISEHTFFSKLLAACWVTALASMIINAPNHLGNLIVMFLSQPAVETLLESCIHVPICFEMLHTRCCKR